jgi:hypothetical protein
MNLMPNQSPEPTAGPSSRRFEAKADGAVSAARRRWLSFFR